MSVQANARTLRLVAVARYLAMGVALLSAMPAAQAADAAACAGCHGVDGHSAMVETPSLAGQPAAYLARQLHLFRDGQRPSPIMTPLAGGLSDADIDDLAAGYAALVPRPSGAPDEPAVATGRRVAESRFCASCHQPDFAGNGAYPRLAGQRADYLTKSLRDFRDGRRSADDPMMNEVVQGMSDADLVALASFLSQLP
ncbi:MAG: cytochrome c4 [Gammaproteobacteria bacterium]|nr:cytochrome c4 [Gammaproteobacteria bacterium]